MRLIYFLIFMVAGCAANPAVKGQASPSTYGVSDKTLDAWTDRVARKVKPLIVFNPESIAGNPACVIKVTLAPDGAILATAVMIPSGFPEWDQAALKALTRAESLPLDVNGKIPQREVRMTFRPKD